MQQNILRNICSHYLAGFITLVSSLEKGILLI